MDLVKSKSSTNKAFPIDTLRHCLSFLGSSDNYYFLASVCKDFKTVVEQLYRGNRNTSTESIIATVSTCNHVIDLFLGRMNLIPEEIRVYIGKIKKCVFDNDRVDIFEESIKPVRTNFLKETIMIGYMKEYILSAINYRSTEIMRSIIKNQKNVQFMKYQMSRDDVPVSLASNAPAACDVHMIKDLIRYGVVFNAISLLFALKRNDLDTFEYLVDVVKVRVCDREEKIKVVFEALAHQKYNDAYEMLMRNGIVCFTALEQISLCMITTQNPTLDRVKFLLECFRYENTSDRDQFLHHLICVCVKMRRMDILTYMNTSWEIDVESFVLYFQVNDDVEAAEFLRGML